MPVQAGSVRPNPGERQFVAWIPPGTYSAIVLNSSGDVRRWAVSIVTRSVNVPVVVPAGGNVVMPFKEGWTVAAPDEARVVSRLVPFEDTSLYNKAGERAGFVLSAWGIGANGPVPFVYQEVVP